MKTVTLHGPRSAGHVALVDDEDYEFIMLFRWFLFDYSGSDRSERQGPYAIARPSVEGRQRIIYMHKLLTGWTQTDHIDHDGLNNQRSNLRPATATQNAQNALKRRSDTYSRYKGVSRSRKKWAANIRVNGKSRYLGLYPTEEDAARAYDAVAREEFGEFACVNFTRDAIGAEVNDGRLSA